MLIIPAIDLRAGNVVRLFQGKQDAENVYSHNPVTVARHWQKQGAQLIHVVDLDGAFSGKPQNLDEVKKIVKAIDVPLEFGGGVRTSETIKELFAIGVKRVVLGTKAVEDQAFLREVFDQYHEQVIVSIDTRNGQVVTQGWVDNKAHLTTLEFACQLERAGFKEVIYTDTAKDGTLKGPDVAGIRTILERTELSVIASGGISSLDDIAALQTLEKDGISGVIIGKALYEEKFTLKEALKLTGK